MARPKKPTRKPTILKVNSGKAPQGKKSKHSTNKEVSFEEIVHREAIDAITAISNKKTKIIDLFEVKDNYMFYTIDKTKFNVVLNKSKKFFEEKEDYEMCGKCQTLLKKYSE